MDIVDINRQAWNKESAEQGEWSQPVSSEQIKQARNGQWSIILTPNKAVPANWFGDIKGKQLLGLASGGGQQMPILAAAGAVVTSFDNSDEQLAKDKQLSDEHQLNIAIEQGDMADLSRFEDNSFDVIFHPVSNCFVPDIDKVWKECARVLKPQGRLLAGFCNPAMYLFDHDKSLENEQLVVEFKLPYSTLTAGEEHLQSTLDKGDPIEFSHSLDSQIGGQIAAGFALHGFYEDDWNDEAIYLNRYMPTSMATLAIKN